jgi:tRNA (guanine37-N1)-methyltransferase
MTSRRRHVTFHVVSLFPEVVRPYLESSILGRAQGLSGKKKGHDPLFSVRYYNPRDYSTDAWKRVDQRPYGGGPGMVLEPESILKAVDAAVGKKRARIIFFSPSGKQFTQEDAQVLSKESHVVFLCGRYEGIDARVVDILAAEAVSVGPYVLTGGELPAATIIDAVARHIPGVLGDSNSLEEVRTSTHKVAEQESVTASSRVYTKPEVLTWKRKKYPVPAILKSGNHAAIEAWRKTQSSFHPLPPLDK